MQQGLLFFHRFENIGHRLQQHYEQQQQQQQQQQQHKQIKLKLVVTIPT